MSKIANPTKVITGVNTRRSYANVWDPKSINGAAPKYSVSLIIPKSDTVTVNKIKAAIQAAYEEGESKLKGTAKVCPALDVIKTPLRDGDKERPGDEAYKDSYFINANSATAPGIVDADRQQIIDRSEVYSGVYGRASINLYAFTSNGNRGIACPIQKPSPNDSSLDITLFRLSTQAISLSNFSFSKLILYSLNPSVVKPGLISKKANLLLSA